MNTIRIVGISSSFRRANTEIIVKGALEAAKASVPGVETTFVSFAGKRLSGCRDCEACVRGGTYCVLKDDWPDLARVLYDPVPDGLIIGSPVYHYSVNSALRAFLERCTSLIKKKFFPDFPLDPPDWTHTVGAALAVGQSIHGGQEHALGNILDWLLVNDFVVVGGYYTGGPAYLHEIDTKDAVLRDDMGLAAARTVGRRVAYTARLVRAGRRAVAEGRA
jgi:multimeric flavodoxin WrbA